METSVRGRANSRREEDVGLTMILAIDTGQLAWKVCRKGTRTLTFTSGALLAAHWVQGKRGWFSMMDVLR